MKKGKKKTPSVLTKIKVVGVGGAGGNIVSRMMAGERIKGVEFIAINTDAQDLNEVSAHKKIYVGRALTKGLGAGMNPEIGRQAIEENRSEIGEILNGADIVFLTAGFGGGCLRGDSLILTNPEGPVRIDSIKPGSMVYTFDNGQLAKRRVLAAMKTGIKKVLELKTNNRTIYASSDHPFLQVVPLNNLSNGRFSQFVLKWTELNDLKAGDLVVILKETHNERTGLSFVYPFRSERVSNFSEFFKSFGFSKVKSIKEIGEEEVYDITVEGSHNFIAEGFVVHNTGTGGLPVVADICREKGILTIAIVTKPFSFEGAQRMNIAQEGLTNLKDKVDALVVIPNDRIFSLIDKETPILKAFGYVDEILKNGVKAIADLINLPGIINIDFADIKAILKEAGPALLGVGLAAGQERAIKAINAAVNSPLLEIPFDGAKGVILSISGGADLKMSEVFDITKAISNNLDSNARVIFGAYQDRRLKNKQLRVIVIATGFNGLMGQRFNLPTLFEEKLITEEEPIISQKKEEEKTKKEEEKIENPLEPQGPEPWEIPAFLRRKKRK